MITCLYIPHFGATKKENSKANEVIFFRIYSIFNLLQIVKNNQQKEGHRRKEKKKTRKLKYLKSTHLFTYGI